MPGFILGVDTSVFIAAICGWHERHTTALQALDRHLAEKHKLHLPVHALLETYAVLTRLPPPHRLNPADAMNLIDRNLPLFTDFPGLHGGSAIKWLHGWARKGAAGGRVYDLAILEEARAAGAVEFLTLNERDVASFAGDMRISTH